MLKQTKSSVILAIMLTGMSNYVLALNVGPRTCLALDQSPNDWTNGRYTDNANGTVTDSNTGLMWKTCSEGLIWVDANDCTSGSLNSVIWQGALQAADDANTNSFASQTDWRLPNVEELNTLSATNCHTPAINDTIFPDTYVIRYWTSSPVANSDTQAWVVNFKYGESQVDTRSTTYPVRLVRTP